MILEIDGTDEFIILGSYHYSYAGDYRVIKFNQGFYGIQKLINGCWVTILVSPVKDNSDEDVFVRFKGHQIISEMLRYIDEADNSFNGDYWRLNVFLSEDGVENFTEIISHGDADTLLGQIGLLYQLEEEQRRLYIKEYPIITALEYVLGIIIVSCILLGLFILCSVYGVL